MRKHLNRQNTDAGSTGRRHKFRPEHLRAASVGQRSGWIGKTAGYSDSSVAEGLSTVEAGALLDSSPAPQAIGSWLLLRGEDASSVLARLKGDIYAREGVWDLSSASLQKVAVAKW